MKDPVDNLPEGLPEEVGQLCKEIWEVFQRQETPRFATMVATLTFLTGEIAAQMVRQNGAEYENPESIEKLKTTLSRMTTLAMEACLHEEQTDSMPEV